MATSITQAKPLLTAAELELFDHSRATPIKAFTAKQLAGKEKRVRALRDKYRDLYRRQTVAQRAKAGKGAASASDANARTQRKADIMQEVLERFETRSAFLESRAQREADKKPAKSGRLKSTKTDGKGPPKAKKTADAKATGAARKAPSKKTPDGVSPAKTSAAKSVAKSSKRPGTVSASSAGKPKTTEGPISAVKDLSNGASVTVQIEHLTGQDPSERSHKAPSDRAPTYGDKAHAPDVNAPLDMVPAAQRANPVRNMPGNIAIQGHVSSAVRRAQGKKDSR